jgi:acetyl esterase/lipase
VSSWSPPEQAAQRYSFLVDQGFTVFSVRHGSSPRFVVPEAYADVKLATRYINLHARDFGVDPERLGVYGSSAGGHLSLMLGLTADDGNAAATNPVERAPSHIAAIVAYFPPTDLRRMVGPSDRFPALNFEQGLADGVSPILYVSPDDPPTLLMHGDEDTLVNISHSQNIYTVFNEQGVTSEFITYPGQGHGFRGEDAELARQEVVDWFSEHLLGTTVANR